MLLWFCWSPDFHTGILDVWSPVESRRPACSGNWPLAQAVRWRAGESFFFGPPLAHWSFSGVMVNHIELLEKEKEPQPLSHFSFLLQQDKGSEVCRALQENWGLQEMSGLLGFLGLQDQRAPKETMEIVQVRNSPQSSEGLGDPRLWGLKGRVGGGSYSSCSIGRCQTASDWVHSFP